MIDKTINDLHFKAGLWNSKGELSPSTHASNDPCVKEALTAIYEIGLGVIGADEELEPLNVWIEKTRNHGGTSEEYWRLYEIINNHNNLREGQRKAWAKACGVAEK